MYLIKHNFYEVSTLGNTQIHRVILALVKFVYSEKTTKFCEISNLLLYTVHTDKSKVEVLQNFVAFSEYMNFICKHFMVSIFEESFA